MRLGLRIEFGAGGRERLVKWYDLHRESMQESHDRSYCLTPLNGLLQNFGVIDGGDNCFPERGANDVGSGLEFITAKTFLQFGLGQPLPGTIARREATKEEEFEMEGPGGIEPPT